MIENIIGWVLVLAIPLLIAFVGIYLIRRSMRKAAEDAARRAFAIEQYRKEQNAKIINRKKELEEDSAREKLRQHPNYGNSRFDPKNPNTLLPEKKSVSSFSTNTREETRSNTDIDWVTPALILATMHSNSGAASAKVDEDTGSVTFKEEKSSSWSSSWDNDDKKSSSSWSSGDSSSSWDSSSSDIGSSSSWD